MASTDKTIEMVSVTTKVPEEMKAAIEEIAESREESVSEVVLTLLANALTFDLAPLYEQRNAERAAREAKKAAKEAVAKQTAESKKALNATIIALVEQGMSFEDIAKQLKVSLVK